MNNNPKNEPITARIGVLPIFAWIIVSKPSLTSAVKSSTNSSFSKPSSFSTSFSFGVLIKKSSLILFSSKFIAFPSSSPGRYMNSSLISKSSSSST